MLQSSNQRLEQFQSQPAENACLELVPFVFLSVSLPKMKCNRLMNRTYPDDIENIGMLYQ